MKLIEGVYDPGILKAIWIVGGAGSGKSFISSHLFGIPNKINISQYGLKSVNQDTEFEYFLKKYGFGADLDAMPDELFRQLTDPAYDDYSGLRSRTKELSLTKLKLYANGRLGVIIDGTGRKYDFIKNQKNELEKLGYDTYMIFVNTSLDVAQKRNSQRKRKLKPDIVTSIWHSVQDNMGKFQHLFNNNFVIIDNSKYISNPEKHFNKITKKYVDKFIKAPVKNKIGRKWIDKQLLLKKTKIKENNFKINRIIAVYSGRFQPFHLGHYHAYEFLVKKFGKNNVYIATSNVTNKIKSPFSFKEKQLIISKLFNIPTSHIVHTKNPYNPVEIISNFDENTTALVVGLGKKDSNRLSSGKYYNPYNKNIKLSGYKEAGYVITVPQLQLKLDGRIITGTLVRDILKTTMNKHIFTVIFGKYDVTIANLIKNKLNENYLIEDKIKFRSAGIIPYIEEGSAFKYLLLYDGKNWSFPKGHIESGESVLVAAKRETKEETGISKFKLQPGFKQKIEFYVKYDYVTNKKLPAPAKKEVIYFLGKVDNMSVKLSNEHKKYKWVTYKEGLSLLKFGADILKSAHNFNKITTEDIDFFLVDNNIKNIINEATITSLAPVDDGPPTFYKSFSEYKKNSTKWINSMYENIGWKIIHYILSNKAEDPDIDYTLSYNIVPAVAYGKSGDGKGYPDPVGKYKEQLKKVVGAVGWEIVNWLGINGNGIDVEAPNVAGADDKTENSDDILKKLGINEEINDVLDSIEISLLTEGGNFGHLQHPFEDKNLTFGDFKKIIEMSLSGTLNREDNVWEKMDGQALAISWKNNKLIASRNKGHRKNFGEKALDINGIISKFEGRGDIKDAFVFAMKDLNKAIKKLSDKQKLKIFAEGEKFLNLEIVWPSSKNVINYDVAVLQFHGTTRYDKDGNAIEYSRKDAKIFEGMVRQINSNIQKHFNFIKIPILKMKKHQDFSKRKKYYLNKLNKLQKEFNLLDSDNLSMYHQRFWEEFIFNAAKQFDYTISRSVLIGLVNRWAFFDKSYKVSDMKHDIKNDDFLDWVLTTDKIDHIKYVKQNMFPFETLFFELGAEILSNMEGFVSANPDKAVQEIKAGIVDAIKKIKAGNDLKKLNILSQQLEKIKSYGGFDKIVPTEGLVFAYTPTGEKTQKIYKITGNFGPINSILGLLKFNR